MFLGGYFFWTHMQRTTNTERLQELDSQLCNKLKKTKADCQELSKVLLPFQEIQINAIQNMCRKSVQELQQVAQMQPDIKLDASMDVMQHCASELEKIKAALLTLQKQVLHTTRFAATAYNDTHNSMLPHMSQQEIECINDMNQFIPRAST